MNQEIRVRVRDISFAQVAADHGLDVARMNPLFRDEWEAMRGKMVTIVTPHLPHPEQDCVVGGRVWLTSHTLWRSMCEHQIEVGD